MSRQPTTKAAGALRTGVYLRISKGDEDQTATTRQRVDCEAFVARQGWAVADVFEDVDLSAYNRKTARPEYERLIRAVRDHELDVVIAWHVDRLSRQQSSFVRLMDAIEDAGAFLVGVTDGVDTRQETGRFIADLLVSHARMASADASRRLRRKHEELAKAGKLSGYGRRSFGFCFNPETKTLDIREPEAIELRAGVQRILHEGAAVRTVLKDWVARGVKAPGGAWQQTNFRTMITSARIAGMREYGGELTPGTWPGIITRDELLALRERLNGHHVATARTYLLSGMCRCGKCGARMVSRADSRKHRRYVCPPEVDGDNCGGISRAAERVEEWVKSRVLEALDGANLAAFLTVPTVGDEPLHAQIAADEAKLKEIAQDYADDSITKSEWFAVRDHLNARLDQNRKRLAKANGHGMLSQYVGAGERLAAEWEQRDLDWRRAVITAVVDHVVINPQHGPRFDPSTVTVVWKF